MDLIAQKEIQMIKRNSFVRFFALGAFVVGTAYAAETPITFINDTTSVLYYGYTENGHWHGITSIDPTKSKGVANPPSGAQFALSKTKNDLELESDGGKATNTHGVYSYPSNVTVVKYDGNNMPTIQQGLNLSTTRKDSGSGCLNQSSKCIYSNVSVVPLIFLATNDNQGFSGNLGGTSGADAKCNGSSERPSTDETYKALITYKGNGSNEERYACKSAGNCGGDNSKNWVLKANTTYYNSSYNVIGKTTSESIFTFPLTNYLSQEECPANNAWLVNAWTGTMQDWTTDINNCEAWTSSMSHRWGAIGYSASLNLDAIGQTTSVYGLDCHLPLSLYCVSQ